eukprot:GILJ01019548.1.p1 GENE.GILJ01019548.1~~GILJ01019548.1.p1  ORF type:complete len:802 (+),score=111.26 GILJ01019548.1:238-2406(+)
MVTSTYLPATQSSSGRLNGWFTDALALWRETGNEEGAVRTKDGRFLSYAHIRHAESGLHLLAVVSTADHKYFSDVKELQGIMIAVGVCCAALVVGLGLGIIYFVSVPIRGLKEGMGFAATLQNEKVVPTRSFLSEINSLCVAFAKMNAMLTEAKAYMPASMLVRYTSEEDSDDDDQDEGRLMSVRKYASGRRSNMSSPADSVAPRHINNIDANTEYTVASANGRHASPDALSHASLRNRRVALLAVNVRGFTALPDFAINTIAGHSTALLDLIAAAAASERGVIDSFHGDHFMISFNAVKPVGSPGRRAVQCSSAIHQAVAGTAYERLSMGASCGMAVVGSLGNLTQRRLSIIGGCYTKALRLQRAAASLERSVEPLFGKDSAPASCFHCLIDGAARAECVDSFDMVLVGGLRAYAFRGREAIIEEFTKVVDVSDSMSPRSDGSPLNGVEVNAQALHHMANEIATSAALKKKTSSTYPIDDVGSANSKKPQPQLYAVVFDLGKDHDKQHHLGRNINGEWMYEIHQKSMANPFRLVNEAMEAAMKGGDIITSARDRHAQLLQESRSNTGAVKSKLSSMAAILSSVSTLLEQANVHADGVQVFAGHRAGSKVADISHSAPSVRLIQTDKLRLDFEQLGKQIPAGLERLISSLLPPTNSSDTHLSQPDATFNLQDPVATNESNSSDSFASSVEMAELLEWLRIAYLAYLAREAGEEDFSNVASWA